MKFKLPGFIFFCLFLLWNCASRKAPEPIYEVLPPSEAQDTAKAEEPSSDTQEQEFTAEDLDYFDHEKEIERALKTDQDQPPTFDIPMVINERVEWWLKHFQKDGRRFFKIWLSRSGKYIPMMKKILRENGLPEDLVYLAMIESGFKPYAYSRARAVGPWQFMRRTGRRYGLRADWSIDERRDPEKSTIAAAQHLKDLYDEFDHWYLAAAGYNAGAGKIKRAIKRYSTEDFWEMSKYRYLRRETKNYVPKMIAAAQIAKNPKKYGFTDITYEEPLEYDKVVVSKSTDLKSIANAIGTSYKELRKLNPELLRWFTPPKYPNYELKIPKGSTDKFLSNKPNFKNVMISSTVKHRLRWGETLSHVANSYGTSVYSLMAINGIKNPRRLRAGKTIIVPVRAGTRPRKYTYAARSSSSTIKHRLRRGETLSHVANAFGISVNSLIALNNISNPKRLRAGQTINVPSRTRQQKIDKETYKKMLKKDGAIGYTVRSGDSIWSISRAFNVTVSEIRRWNKLGSVRKIYPGNKLVIYPRFVNGNGNGNGTNGSPKNNKSKSTPTNAKLYKVRRGDTLWDISRKYNISMRRLVLLNNLKKKGKKLQPGDVIKLAN